MHPLAWISISANYTPKPPLKQVDRKNAILHGEMTVKDIPAVDMALKREFKAHPAPIIELIEAQTKDPFKVLVGTILSARTKDACTAGAVRRLFAAGGGTPDGLEALPVEKIERLIHPVGFFRAKARHLKALPAVLREKFGGVLPQTVEELCALPGVGRKTANLTVAVGFDLPAICVDVHVHRISNRWGLIKTATPFETEMTLREKLPVRYWKTWNTHLVSFGQSRCYPRSPRCGDCPLRTYCPAARPD
jgi:endonuclease III